GKADRVVAANRYYHGASLRDLARRGRRARLAEGHIATRDENIPTVREPDALEVMALSLDVEPTGAGAIGAGFPEPGARFANEARPGEGPRPDEGNDHSLVGRDAQERDPGVEPVEVIDRGGAEERPRRRSRQWADWLFRFPRHPHPPRTPASTETALASASASWYNRPRCGRNPEGLVAATARWLVEGGEAHEATADGHAVGSARVGARDRGLRRHQHIGNESVVQGIGDASNEPDQVGHAHGLRRHRVLAHGVLLLGERDRSEPGGGFRR